MPTSMDDVLAAIENSKNVQLAQPLSSSGGYDVYSYVEWMQCLLQLEFKRMHLTQTSGTFFHVLACLSDV